MAVSESTVHQWLGRNYPKSGRCEECGREGQTHYAFLRHPEPHTRERADYRELCPSCHKRMDVRDKRRRRLTMHAAAGTASESRRLLRTKEAAALVGCHVLTIRRAIDRGDLQTLRLGAHGTYRIPRESLDNWLRLTRQDGA